MGRTQRDLDRERPADVSTGVEPIGVAGFARFGRLLDGGGGESALPQRQVSAGWTNTIKLGSAMLDAGYVVIDRSHFTVYPQVSIGIRATSRAGAFSIGVRARMVTPVGAPGTVFGESTVSGAPPEESGWHLRLTIGKPVGRRRDVVSALDGARVDHRSLNTPHMRAHVSCASGVYSCDC